ncbi:MAG: quinoprotein dehydrogenase-associated SoxYZ-like carrier [Pseudomonadota bacterium]
MIMQRLLLALPLALALLVSAPIAAAQQSSPVEDVIWQNGLRDHFFPNEDIWDGDGVVSLEAPYRAQNAAIVPVNITAAFPQSEDRYIETIWLIVDKNPGPLAGRFDFSAKAGRADLALRLRIDQYSPIRVVARTNDGRLHMTRTFVKASGGCSAPAGADLDAAMARLGKMKFRELDPNNEAQARQFQLNVSHPNINGMQMDQLTQLYLPAHFVRDVKVSLDGEQIFSAQTGFSISENPSFRFYMRPEVAGKLTAEVTDTKDMKFSQTFEVANGGTGQ